MKLQKNVNTENNFVKVLDMDEILNKKVNLTFQ